MYYITEKNHTSLICKGLSGLVESARVNGKPRLVKQKYLGTAERIASAIDFMSTGVPKPDFSTVFDFGAVAALFDIADRLGIRSIIDRHAGKREQGLPVSDTILLAAINRAVAPTSKKSFYEWYSKTVLYNMFPVANEKNLSSQGFWNNMSILTQEKIRKIEDEITKAVVEQYDIDTVNSKSVISISDKAVAASRWFLTRATTTMKT